MKLSTPFYLRFSTFILIGMLLSSCATYHQKNAAFYEQVYTGNYEQAEKVIDANKNLYEMFRYRPIL